jgi:hypothetical protein
MRFRIFGMGLSKISHPPARSSWVRTILTGLVVLALTAGSPVLAGIGADSPLRAPSRPDLTCSRSTSSTRQLAMIDSTSEGGFQCLGVSLEGHTVKAIRLEAHRFAAARQIKVTEFPPATVESNRGAVLDGIPGHDAIVLHGNFSTPSGRPVLELSFLYNGITGEYRTCQLSLDQTPDTGWRLVNSRDQPVSHIVVRIRQLPVIGIVGIADLEGACASRAQ